MDDAVETEAHFRLHIFIGALTEIFTLEEKEMFFVKLNYMAEIFMIIGAFNAVISTEIVMDWSECCLTSET